ncbi:MAG: alpha-amylase family glycosyl hydrolase [Erythrobacter sp.]
MIARVLLGLAAGLAATGAAAERPHTPQAYVQFENAAWTRDAVIYQINTRQFTREGTLRAAAAHLPRLAEMGIDIVWLMPIHPIGAVGRKGTMGSPYAVQDYRAINPDLGQEADLKAFVERAHGLGMKVILDWVANHSAWDNPLTHSHPEWYQRSPEGNLMPPEGTDWSDVVAFDYANPALREYMAGSLAYWVREFGIDGFRADVAGYVPLDFWEVARAQLDEIKPVFMLAEWEQRDLHARAFDATYAWRWKEVMQRIARGEADASAMRAYYAEHKTSWPHAAYRMVYTDNHDQNAWDGVAADIYGPAYQAAIALSFAGPGIPLIHNGQEADLAHKLAFFEKDEIVWNKGRHDLLIRQLIALKTAEPALHNGRYGGAMIDVPNSVPEAVLSFVRQQGASRVFAVFNLSGKPRAVQFTKPRHHGAYIDALSGQEVEFTDEIAPIKLPAWGFRLYRLNAANSR